MIDRFPSCSRAALRFVADGVDPLKVLANDSDFAKWKNEGLAADQTSLENAAIITQSLQVKRWPLLIDPQLKAIKWIRGRFKDVVVTQQTQPGYISQVIDCITKGKTLLLDGCPEELDATLEPILSRSFIQRGSSRTIRVRLCEECLFFSLNALRMWACPFALVGCLTMRRLCLAFSVVRAARRWASRR